MKTALIAVATLLTLTAPARADLGRDRAYAGGALYGATCALYKGRITEAQAGLVVYTTLKTKGINPSLASDPIVQKVAQLMFLQKGC